jgi:hypothetical protein
MSFEVSLTSLRIMVARLTRIFWDDQVSTPDFDGIFSLIPVGGVQATHSIEFTDHLHGREGLQLVLRSLF